MGQLFYASRISYASSALLPDPYRLAPQAQLSVFVIKAPLSFFNVSTFLSHSLFYHF